MLKVSKLIPLERNVPNFRTSIKCSIPVFEGFIENKQHDRLVSDILFTYCEWHALAKLRLHSDSTVDSLEVATTELGRITRLFQKETSIYDTKELRKEVAARGRRHVAMVKKDGDNTFQAGPKPKTLNINTPKIHFLGYYAPVIRKFRSIDNVTTQIVSFFFLGLSLPLIPLYRANRSISVSSECSDGQIRGMRRGTSANSRVAHERLRSSSPEYMEWLRRARIYPRHNLGRPRMNTTECRAVRKTGRTSDIGSASIKKIQPSR